MTIKPVSDNIQRKMGKEIMMSLLSPVKLLPACKSAIWGGNRLKTQFNKVSELENIAETWELSSRKDGSSVINSGEYKGMEFTEYVSRYGKEVLGSNALKFDCFPILIKFIDAMDNLSIQVHPDDAYALEHEGELGKSEMWYIVNCDEGAYIYYGFNRDLTRSEFSDRIKNNTLLEVLNKVTVKKGDCFYIEAGTVHAIGAGILICEVQENSNTTYRVYDYDRRDKNGNTRELHIEKSMEAANLIPVSETEKSDDSETLAKCKYFTVKKFEINGTRDIEITRDSFASVIVTDGCGVLELDEDKLEFIKGDSVFVPAQNGKIKITGKCEVIFSKV